MRARYWILALAGATLAVTTNTVGFAASKAVTGSFIGSVAGSRALVSLTLVNMKGANGRDLTAYLCDGFSNSYWFRGVISSDKIDIRSAEKVFTSEGTARLQGTITAGGAHGTVTLPSGIRLSFSAPRASGPGGLYIVNILSNGTARGTSDRGGRIDGTVASQSTNGFHGIKGTISTPEGKRLPFTSPGVRDLPKSGLFGLRVIISSDGKVITGAGGTSGDRFNVHWPPPGMP